MPSLLRPTLRLGFLGLAGSDDPKNHTRSRAAAVVPASAATIAADAADPHQAHIRKLSLGWSKAAADGPGDLDIQAFIQRSPPTAPAIPLHDGRREREREEEIKDERTTTAEMFARSGERWVFSSRSSFSYLISSATFFYCFSFLLH
jgi:hypothetical protein